MAQFDPVITPEGLIGVVLNASERTSVAMTWAHPEFRVSAFTVTGDVIGIVAPSLLTTGDGALEFRGVAYRDSVPTGTLVVTSGLGGVYPQGIPVGTVTGIVREQPGWERVYRLRPARESRLGGPRAGAAHPSGRGPRAGFSQRLRARDHPVDSIARVRRADSLADAERLARAARAESLAAVRRDTTVAPAPRRPAATAQTPRPAAPAAPRAPATPSPASGDSVR